MRLFFILILSGLCIQLNVGFTSETKNIVDYYLTLPGEYFVCDAGAVQDTKDFRTKCIQYKNIKNGYLRAKVDNGMQYPLEVALYKDRINKRDIIAVSIDCGPGCMCNVFKLLTLDKKGQWEVIENILPIQEMEKTLEKALEKSENELFPAFVLPEFGTTIKVIDSESKKLLYELIWQGGKFQIKESVK
ncbi:hypothetical protein JW964_06395 [candidate division KSB1 bacterium]|nr:hypothetical protein [candidate division KSB1 bacterium]